MNARLTTPTFAVVSSEAKQTARVEVALRAGPAEPERRSDVADDNELETVERVIGAFQEVRRRGWQERVAAGVGAGDDKTPPLTPNELAEVDRLVAEIHTSATKAAKDIAHASDWESVWPTVANFPEMEGNKQTAFPSVARNRLEKLRAAVAVLHGMPSEDALVRTKLLDDMFFLASIRVQTAQLISVRARARKSYVSRLELFTEDIVSGMGEGSAPRLKRIADEAELRALFLDTISEIVGEKVPRKRLPGADDVARWIETSYILALRLDIETGELDAWATWAKKAGYTEKRRVLLASAKNPDLDTPSLKRNYRR